MNLSILSLLFSLLALASPDRQFICKYSDLVERMAYFISISADGNRLKSMRFEGESTVYYDLTKVTQFRYFREPSGREYFYAFYNGNESEMSFSLEFSGENVLRGKETQFVVDPQQETEPAEVQPLGLTCNRII